MTDQERLEAELHRDIRRWTVRRRIAISSFISLVFCLLYYAAIPFLLTKEQAGFMADFNSIIITLIGTFAGIVTFYIGAVTYSDKNISLSSK